MSHNNATPSNKNISLTIDGLAVTVPEGTRILDAAKKVNVTIPTLCDYPELCKRAVCRLCVVECDGRGKLVAACANDVWEGVNVVTNNARLMNIRKTILELLLTNHPSDCLSCIKSGQCELQKLAETFGIRNKPFARDAADRKQSLIEGGTLVRDMDKCVKCGRCVEVCQEVQSVRAINTSHRSVNYEICTPYGQALADGSCVFCCQCVAVCPVGAIYGHDQSDEVWAALDNSELKVAAQIAAHIAPTQLDGEFGLTPGTITSGRLVTALKLMGFDKVYDAASAANETVITESRELLERIKSGKAKLPMITSCSPALSSFIEKFYPDLKEHLSSCKNPEQVFASVVKGDNSKALDSSKLKSVSIMPCIAKKHGGNGKANELKNVDLTLSFAELCRMIKIAGIEFDNLAESAFDSFPGTSSSEGSSSGVDAIVKNVYSAYTGERSEIAAYKEVQGNVGIKEAEIDLQGNRVKALAVSGLANARIVLDSIRKGECDAAFVEVQCCPTGCSESGAPCSTGRHSQK